MTLIMLLEWWNLIYVVPFGLAVMYLALFVFTGITFGHGDADIDADADIDVPAEGSVHVGAHVLDADSDADVAGHEVHVGEHDVNADGDDSGNGQLLTHVGAPAHGPEVEHGSLVGDLLSFLGIGKIPLSLALMILLLIWGVAGFALNAILVPWLGANSLVGFITLPVTAIISVGLTGACAAVIAKFIPLAEAKGQRREDLVGRAGDAIYDIHSTFGMAAVRNASGDLFQVPCQTVDAKTRIPKGTRVVLFDYDREKGVFHAVPLAV